jgi:hypothetical protein
MTISTNTHVSDPAVQVRTTIPNAGNGVAQVNGVYAVLEGLRQGQDVLMGGYGYLEWSGAGNAWHEGLDLNSMGGGDSDLGARVVAPLDGVVTSVLPWNGTSVGFGNHLALWVDDRRAAQPCFLHVAHLAAMTVRANQRVTAGEQLGTCGKSGRQPYAHVHAALWHDIPPGGWGFWQTGYSKEWVRDHTLDPQAWFWASAAKAGDQTTEPTPIPPEALKMLEDWQISNWILAPLFEWAGLADAFNPDSATSKAWIAELRAGRYRGRPRTGERPYGEGHDIGLWMEWEAGVLLYRVGDGATSWTG